MGTNYYIKTFREEKNKCEHCGRADITPEEEIHIGKKSGGWKFIFNPRFKSWDEWKKFIWTWNLRIFDEYERNIPFDEFCEVVEKGQDGRVLGNPQSEFMDPKGYCISHHEEFF